MTQIDSVHSTPRLNTSVSQIRPQDGPSRRRFLSKAAGVAAGGTVLALATIPPALAAAAPAATLDATRASPALKAAVQVLDDALDRAKEARRAFDAADRLPGEWRKLNPKPTDRRAIKRWNRRGQDYYDSVLGPPWHALRAAEKDFRDAQMAVAKIDARDMGELAPQGLPVHAL